MESFKHVYKMEKGNSTLPTLIAISSFAIGLVLSWVIDNDFLFWINQSIVVAIFGSMTSHFLEFCYRPGNIFGWWVDFLEKYFRDNPKNPVGFLWKPLGGCVQCHNIWITMGIFIVLLLNFNFSWWGLYPALILSNFMLTIYIKLLWE